MFEENVSASEITLSMPHSLKVLNFMPAASVCCANCNSPVSYAYMYIGLRVIPRVRQFNVLEQHSAYKMHSNFLFADQLVQCGYVSIPKLGMSGWHVPFWKLDQQCQELSTGVFFVLTQLRELLI